MPIQYYMDEQVPRPITVGLRRLRIDVLTTQEDGAEETHDRELLLRATELQRVMFSRDDDMLKWARQFQSDGTEFAGLIYAHQLNVSIGRCIQDLALVAECMDPLDMYNRVEYLPL